MKIENTYTRMEGTCSGKVDIRKKKDVLQRKGCDCLKTLWVRDTIYDSLAPRRLRWSSGILFFFEFGLTDGGDEVGSHPVLLTS